MFDYYFDKEDLNCHFITKTRMFMVKRKTIYKWLFSFFWDWSKVIQHTPTEMFKIKRLITPNVDKDIKQPKDSYNHGGNAKMVQSFWKIV